MRLLIILYLFLTVSCHSEGKVDGNVNSSDDTQERTNDVIEAVEKMLRILGSKDLPEENDLAEFLQGRKDDLHYVAYSAAGSKGLGCHEWILEGIANSVIITEDCYRERIVAAPVNRYQIEGYLYLSVAAFYFMAIEGDFNREDFDRFKDQLTTHREYQEILGQESYDSLIRAVRSLQFGRFRL